MTRKTAPARAVHARLIEAIGKIDRPGRFCTSGTLPLTMPGLEVDGLGTVRMPLGKAQGRKLIRLCRQAPYGKGTETLVDTNVRRVWELDPADFQLTNPKWDALVAEIVDSVQAELGLQNRKLKAHLYKLLLYEKGSFFLPHRDGEKLDRMVATLVIGLPSVHDGGELIVAHDNARQEITFSGAASGHELSYAAFYADCQHEVRPLRSGHRLCLVYNVTLAASRTKRGIAAPTSSETVAAIRSLLEDWRQTPYPLKLAVTFEHRYTQDGLTLDKLKGVDQARAEALFEAAEQADCVAHLALATLWQSGSAEGGDDYYAHRRGGWYDVDTDASEYEMGEVFDHNLSVDHWSDRQGKRVRLGEVGLDEDEIVSEHPLDEGETSREEFEGYTGNAGMTLERWYDRAAIVIWPRDKHFAVLCQAGTSAAIGGLEAMVKRLGRAAKARQEEHRQACRDFAAAIIDSWQPSRGRYRSCGTDTDVDRSVFPRILQELNDPGLHRQLLSEVMVDDGEVRLDRSFAGFCNRHGWQSFRDELRAVIDGCSEATVTRNISLLEALCLHRSKNDDRITLCQDLARRAVAALVAMDARQVRPDWRIEPVDRRSLLVRLVKSLVAVNGARPLARLLNHTVSRSDTYALTDVHVAAILSLQPWLVRRPTGTNREVLRWVTRCRSQLESRTTGAPIRPSDYRRRAKLPCECSDCRDLSKFLADPDEPVHRFSVRKDRRQHLHYIIDSNRCDLTHVTERRGRPHTLVCTKTTASHEDECRTYERDRKNLAKIRAVEKQMLPQSAVR